jgi:hypothetical protein
LAVAGFAAGCGPAVAGSGTAVSPGSSSAASSAAPAAATWQPGGTYTGPVPPADPIPGPRHTWQLAIYTDPNGYQVKDRIIFGVPLHYAVPQRLFDCNSSADYQFDLPPGQYVVPFEVTVKNLLHQQAKAVYPGVSAAVPEGSLPVAGVSGRDTMWSDGNCTLAAQRLLGAGGSGALYGFIGPATPAQLAHAEVSVAWDFDAHAPGPWTVPLHSLLPHQGASWLAAHS